MALVTTLKAADADSYATLAEFQAYAASMGWTLTATDAAQEAALRRATMYLDDTYTWRGLRASKLQALAWPRTDVIDRDDYHVSAESIPARIKSAQCEAAFAILGGVDIMPQRQGAVISETVTAGPVSATTRKGAVPATPRFVSVDLLVTPLTLGGGLSRVMRG